jgi:hypothetical protein
MQTNKNLLIFSVFSGTYYNLPEADIPLLEPGHIPLSKQPKTSCKKCFGRGYTGRDSNNLSHHICSCVQKVINFDILKVIENKHSKLSR